MKNMLSKKMSWVKIWKQVQEIKKNQEIKEKDKSK